MRHLAMVGSPAPNCLWPPPGDPESDSGSLVGPVGSPGLWTPGISRPGRDGPSDETAALPLSGPSTQERRVDWHRSPLLIKRPVSRLQPPPASSRKCRPSAGYGPNDPGSRHWIDRLKHGSISFHRPAMQDRPRVRLKPAGPKPPVQQARSFLSRGQAEVAIHGAWARTPGRRVPAVPDHSGCNAPAMLGSSGYSSRKPFGEWVSKLRLLAWLSSFPRRPAGAQVNHGARYLDRGSVVETSVLPGLLRETYGLGPWIIENTSPTHRFFEQV